MTFWMLSILVGLIGFLIGSAETESYSVGAVIGATVFGACWGFGFLILG